MFKFKKSKPLLAAVAGIGIALSAPAAAQTNSLGWETDPKPGFGAFISPDSIATLMSNILIAAARTQVELQYDSLTTDVLRGRASLAGVRLNPAFEWDRARQCRISIERVVLGTDMPMPNVITAASTADMTGVSMSPACLPTEAATMLRTAGLREVALDHARISASYNYRTGETSLEFSLGLNDVATLDLAGTFTYVPGTRPYEATFRVSRAIANLRDQGGWASLSLLLPPNLREPEILSQMLREQATLALSEGGAAQPGAVERNFIAALMDKVEEFLRDPGEITVEADLPAGGVIVDESMFDSPGTIISALALVARTAPRAQSGLRGIADLAVLGDATAELSDRDRVALGQALLNGDGVPRAPSLVPGLVAPVLAADSKNGAAAILVARAMKDSDPMQAYEFAQTAATSGISNAISLLDVLESRMTSTTMLALQTKHTGPVDGFDAASLLNGVDDARALREKALAHFTGNGEPRLYAVAYYYVLLAEAAGDISAANLRSEIDARFNARGADVNQAWSALRAEVEAKVIADWVSLDLPARYSRN